MNEFEIRDKLKTDRKEIKSFDDLVNFLKEAREYNFDYGGAPRAIAQAALATAWWFAGDFGITHFQASFMMWDFIIDWIDIVAKLPTCRFVRHYKSDNLNHYVFTLYF